MKNISSEITALRAAYQKQIQIREQEIKELTAKLLGLDEVENDQTKYLSVNIDKYKNFGLKQACADAVQSMHDIGAADANGVTAKMVADFISAHGFQQRVRKDQFYQVPDLNAPKGKPTCLTKSGEVFSLSLSFVTSVHVTLDRLAADEQSGIVATRIKNSKYFRIKKQ